MALCELQIINIRELLSNNLNLIIPDYQRPYKWSVNSVNNLFNDIYTEYCNNKKKEYRLGTVILHKDSNEVYNIVDGQQRLTTLAIMLFVLEKESEINLLKQNYDELSKPAILNNMKIIKSLVKDIKDKKDNFRDYILDNCKAVKIVTDSQQEAFQFFDSQNSRGKSLLPHDLLKSYHLREMKSKNNIEKIDLINKWENRKQEEIEQLFAMYLYPLSQWYKGKSGLYYSSDKIEEFKGIKIEFPYNYAIYEKAANLFIEQYNSYGNGILTGVYSLNQFQITNQIIAGKRFFEYTLHYLELLDMVKSKISNNLPKDSIPDKRTGDRYVKQLLEAVSLFYADRFGINELTYSVLKKLHYWAFSLRLVMKSVYKETINSYALGRSDRLNKRVDIFTKINEMKKPSEINLLVFDIPKCVESNSHYYDILKKFMGVE